MEAPAPEQIVQREAGKKEAVISPLTQEALSHIHEALKAMKGRGELAMSFDINDTGVMRVARFQKEHHQESAERKFTILAFGSTDSGLEPKTDAELAAVMVINRGAKPPMHVLIRRNSSNHTIEVFEAKEGITFADVSPDGIDGKENAERYEYIKLISGPDVIGEQESSDGSYSLIPAGNRVQSHELRDLIDQTFLPLTEAVNEALSQDGFLPIREKKSIEPQPPTPLIQ